MQRLVSGYEPERLTVGVIGSHSALDVLDGAKDEGLRTLVVCQRGRELPYLRYKRVADEVVILDRFSDVLKESVQKFLVERNVVFVPNRSFTAYVPYEEIEERFAVPLFGNRAMLRIEERGYGLSYYRLLERAGIKHPRLIEDPREIDGPVIVKLPEAVRRVERGFFVATSYEDFKRKAEELLSRGVIRREDLERAVIEEYVVGVDFYLNYFRSVVRGEVEFHGADRRLQSNLDGVLRMPAALQLAVDVPVRNIEVGHVPVTLRESLLNEVFRMGDRFAEASRLEYPPGIVGPFTLQAVVTPELEFYVFDVAPRIGGGTNAYMGIGSQYSKLYFGRPVSMGRRVAMELRWAAEKGMLAELVT